MREQNIDKSLFENNRSRFAKLLKPLSVAVFNASDAYPRTGDQFYPYRQQSDIFYLTGINQEETVLLIAPAHPDPKMREILFITETSEQMAVWDGSKLTKEEAKSVSGINNVQWLGSLDLTLHELLIWSGHVYLNLYEYPKFATDTVSRDLRFARKLMQHYPAHRFERAAPLLTKLRMVKSEEEIALIRRAIEITDKAFRRLLGFVKPGVHEFEIQAEMIHEFVMNRSPGFAFHPIIASGKNACVLHYHQNNAQCNDGDLVLFDFGAEYANYAADISRTIPVGGTFSPRQRLLYDLVLRVQRKAVQQLVTGNTMDKYNEFVNGEMEKALIGIGLLNPDEVKKQDPEKPLYKKYFMHGTAHHLGLDVHDVINKYEPFAPGMVFTCEPGIYIPDENIGIRLENNILITQKGPVDLSETIPLAPDEIERLMKQ
jgi:Xaa-Pro aminopeptidase